MNKIHFYFLVVISLAIAPFSHAREFSAALASPTNYEPEKYISSSHLVTKLYLSKIEGKRPLLLALAGSSGGFAFQNEPEKIASLTKRGYHVLVAAYVFPKAQPNTTVPTILSRIRLESFTEELSHYLESEKTKGLIDKDLIGILGTSKGGELALLLASLNSQFTFVTAVVPSNVVFQASNTTLAHHSAWTLNQKEVDFVPYPNFSVASLYGIATSLFCREENVNFTWMHTVALKNKKAVRNALIKVENINGPLLLVSGSKDQWWPSTKMSQDIMTRLAHHKFPHFDASAHVTYETDHFPIKNVPHAWDRMLDKMDDMLRYRKSVASLAPIAH